MELFSEALEKYFCLTSNYIPSDNGDIRSKFILAAKSMEKRLQVIDDDLDDTLFIRFKHLPVGARFKHPDFDGICVVVEPYVKGLIAKYEVIRMDGKSQEFYSFVDDEHPLETYVEVIE